MKIVLTSHAKARMRGRLVTLGEIRDVLQDVDVVSIPTTLPQVVRKIIRGRLLEIVFRRKSQTFIIITTYEI